MEDNRKIVVTKNGPYIVYGNIPITERRIKKDPLGRSIEWTVLDRHYPDEIYPLCRCGGSNSMPFCDGKHTKNGFDGTENASRTLYYQNAVSYPGAEGVELRQVPIFCTGAGFCHGVNNISRTIKKERTLEIAKQQICDCPGGSLTLKIDGEEIEPNLIPEISIVSTPYKSGPIWIRGGIPIISTDGHVYEVRNRAALCRCGRSSNRPFCDGTHLR